MTMAGLTAAFGLPYSSQFVLSGHSCCDSGAGQLPRSPHTPTHVCSCQLEQVLQQKMNAASLPLGLFPARANFPTEPNLMFGPTAREASSVYPPLVRQCDIKEMNSRAGFNAGWYASSPRFDHHNFDQPANYLACHRFGDRFSPIDLNSGTRRKNATRETTSTLKAWLYEHQKNPYPTKGEKIMLAILTKMTLTQVSTWFANARRRLKKENKMTWSPRNRCGERKDSEGYSDEDDAVDEEDDDDKIMEEDIPEKRENLPCRQTTVIKTAEDANSAVYRRDPVLCRLTSKLETLTPELRRLQNPDTTNTTPAERTDQRIIWLNERPTTTETDSPQHTSSSLDDSPVKSLRKWVDGCFDERQSGTAHSPVTDTPPLTPPACETEILTERLVHSTNKQNSSPIRESPPTTFDINLTKEMEERSSDHENDATTNRREIDAALALTTLFSRS